MRFLMYLIVIVLFSPASVHADTHFVYPDESGDFATIQAAILGAAEGDTILLGNGVFTGPGNRALDLLGKALHLGSEGGNPEECIIDCEAASHGLSCVSGEGPNTRIQDLTIQGGKSDVGAGVRIHGNSKPTFIGCILRENRAAGVVAYGGGFSIHDSSPRFERCAFIANRVEHEVMGPAEGGAGWCGSDSSEFVDCLFEANLTSWEGGGVYLEESQALFDGCSFVSNLNAVYILYGSPRFTRCHFADNYANAGAATYLRLCGPSFVECTFCGNVVGAVGAGMYCSDVTGATVINCTFFNNEAHGDPAGVIHARHESWMTVENTIVAFSEGGSAVFIGEDSALELTCCNLFGNVGGDWTEDIANQYGINGNISLDPQFCDPDALDLTLAESSPCSPFSPPNPECGLIGAHPVGCVFMDAAEIPSDAQGLWLSPGLPNPTCGATSFSLVVPAELDDRARLQILDCTGRAVCDLSANLDVSGLGSILWDGRDEAGSLVPSGTYFARLSGGRLQIVRQVLIVR